MLRLLFNLTVFSLFCAAQAADVPPAVDDGAIIRRLTKRGTELSKAKDRVHGKVLVDQLKRRSCQVSLVEPATTLTTLDAATIAAQRRDAVAVVASLYLCGRCDRLHVRPASGFFINEGGVIVTCYHVVADADTEVLVAMTAEGRIEPITEVLAGDPAADIAIVRCAGSGFAAAPLGGGAPVGSRVLCLSHPDQHFFVLSEGLVSRYFVDRASRLEMLAITADFARGSSGGPIFDQFGNVVGMVASTQSVYYDEQDGRKANLQMVFKQCVTAKSIRRLIQPAP